MLNKIKFKEYKIFHILNYKFNKKKYFINNKLKHSKKNKIKSISPNRKSKYTYPKSLNNLILILNILMSNKLSYLKH